MFAHLGGTADAHIIETHDLVIRSARRCAYDLAHALDLVTLDKWNQDIVASLRAKQRLWIGIFASGNTAKDYRSELHQALRKSELEIERLRKLLKDNGIEDLADRDRIPF